MAELELVVKMSTFFSIFRTAVSYLYSVARARVLATEVAHCAQFRYKLCVCACFVLSNF